MPDHPWALQVPQELLHHPGHSERDGRRRPQPVAEAQGEAQRHVFRTHQLLVHPPAKVAYYIFAAKGTYSCMCYSAPKSNTMLEFPIARTQQLLVC